MSTVVMASHLTRVSGVRSVCSEAEDASEMLVRLRISYGGRFVQVRRGPSSQPLHSFRH